MITSAADERVHEVNISDDELIVAFVDGRTLSVPLVWYPRLFHASPEQRSDWRLIGDGDGVHWPQIDEDLSAAGLLRGIPAPVWELSSQEGSGTQAGTQEGDHTVDHTVMAKRDSYGNDPFPRPLYMTQFAYTKESWTTLAHSPEDRGVAVRELLEAGGGRLISWYLSFGEYDELLIYEAQDDATAGALVLAAARQGQLATKTTRLFDSEQSMEMMRRAGGEAFRAPADREGEPPEAPGLKTRH